MSDNTSRVGIFSFEVDSSADPAVLAKRAEELGFESFWVPEHAILPLRTTSPYGGSSDGAIPEEYGRIVDPFIALAESLRCDQPDQAGNRNLPGPGAQSPAAGQGDRHPWTGTPTAGSSSALALVGSGRRRKFWAQTSTTAGPRLVSPSRP